MNYQSDGCAAYSVQAFWTQARESLDVVTIIGSNRSYNMLKVELLRAGVTTGPHGPLNGKSGRPLSGLGEDRRRLRHPSIIVDSAEALV